jgi:glycosyltransferase involved in cell wall biosynthesis
LKIISARNYFTQKISKKIKELKLQKQVEILGYIDDHQFIKIYKNALALVHPSLMEGFSLTGLEAMALNCPVISSNASCLPEIYGNSVLYFDPYNTNDLVKKINQLKNSNVLRQRLIKLGQKQVKKYSWDTCAKESMAVYQKLL